MPDYKEIARLYQMGISRNEICRRVRSSRDTVSGVINVLKAHGYMPGENKEISSEELARLFESDHVSKAMPDAMYEMPDYKALAKELAKTGVTMHFLWEEYCYDCRKSGRIPYKLTQFKYYFRSYLSKSSFSDIVHHKPGQEMEVDWAGTQPSWFDPDTGEEVRGYLFIGVLAFSGYAYAEACSDMKEESWINCHIHMFDYFHGIARILVPDNLKTGVVKHPANEEAVLNQSYQDMAEHYGIAIIPARVRHPKDKSMAENTVNQCTKYIIAKLRNYKFFSIDEYNRRLLKELDAFNHKPFQKKPGSRAEIFENSEKEYLLPLPEQPYEFAGWKQAKVASNSHISFDRMFYSVPFQYIGYEVDLKITRRAIAIYYSQNLLCTHKRLYGHPGQYDTYPEHMPKNSNAAQEWNKERFIKWANEIGENTAQVITRLFAQYKYEQQDYNGVKSILMLSRKYSSERLEAACGLALRHITHPRYKNIKAILENRQDEVETNTEPEKSRNESTFLRGRDYYRGGSHNA